MRDPMSKAGDPNPHKADIDSAWWAIENALSLYDGARARDLMIELHTNDRPVWNGCRGRIRKWLVSWFNSRGLGKWDGQPDDDFSADAFAAWLHRIYANRMDPVNFGSDDLPYMIQELRNLARAIDVRPAAPAAEANP